MPESSFDYTLPELKSPLKLPYSSVKITLPPKELTADQLSNFPAFKKWIATLSESLALQYSEKNHKFHNHPYEIDHIEAQSTVWFSKEKLGFVKIQITIKNDEGQIPGAVFLRGGSVAMLMILQSTDAKPDTEDDKFVLLTVQPRVAVGSLAFTEIPAGMIDDGNFKGTAAKEIEEETHIHVTADELINLSDLAAPEETTFAHLTNGADGKGAGTESLSIATYPSPGACDEMIQLFLYQKRLPKDVIEKLKGRETGSQNENEKITLKLVRLENLWKECSRDGKALAALALYEGLRKEGKISKIEELSGEELEGMRQKLGEKSQAEAKM